MAYRIEQVESVDATIINPIVKQILRHIKDTWFFDNDVIIELTDHTGQLHPIGTAANGELGVKFENTKRLTAEVVTRPNRDTAMAYPARTNTTPPWWADDAIRAYSYLHRTKQNISLNLRYVAGSRGEVVAWQNFYQARISNGVSAENLSVSYEVVVPDIIPYTIQKIHATRELRAGYGDTFYDYMEGHAKQPYAIRQQEGSTKKTLVIRETQRNLGVVLPADNPEPSRQAGGAWEAQFTLELGVLIPTSVAFVYDEFIHNNLMPNGFYDATLDYNEVVRCGFDNGDYIERIWGALVDKKQPRYYMSTGYRFPAFDDTLVDLRMHQQNSVLQTRIMVDDANPKLIADLTTLADDCGVSLHPDLVPYLIAERDNLFKYGQSLFCLYVAEGGIARTSFRYSVTDEGLVVADYDLNPRGSYHLCLGINDDIPGLPQAAKMNMCKYGNLVQAAILYNYPHLPPEVLPVPDADGQITVDQLVRVSTYLHTKQQFMTTRMFTTAAVILETRKQIK